MNNPFDTPEAWVRKAYEEAIFDVLAIRTKPVELQKEFEEELRKVEDGVIDVERLKKWVYATQNESIISKIEQKCNSLLKDREKTNKEKLKEESKKTEEYYKQKGKEFEFQDIVLEDIDGKPCIIHPGLYEKDGKLISLFSQELAKILKEKRRLFYRPQSKDVVEITRHEEDGEEYICFDVINPNRFITLIEDYVVPGIIKTETRMDGRKEQVFKYKSITSEIAKTIIQSATFQNKIYKIERIFTVPLPILHNGKLTFPKQGYDERFKSWLPFDAPKIEKPDMKLEEAKEIILNIYQEFCFKSEQDVTNAIAGLLTPFLRGLYPHFNTRTPVFFYLANRERAGKDYCAGVNGIIYEGHALEEPPISNDEKIKSNSNEELRKKLLSSFMHGRQRLHFANNKGHINNSVFEAVATAEKYSDRVLGKNEILTFENEIEFSLSGNVGVTYTPDFANRCRFINLFLDIEDANSRKFKNPDLHGTLKKKRGLILSALYCFVRKWIEGGREKGNTPFASFPIWAEICGGIMNCVGLGNPCKQDKEVLVTGDNETNDMKLLFELCYEKFPEQELRKGAVKEVIGMNEEGIFSALDLGYSKSDQTRFGIMFDKYVGRVFSGIRLIIYKKSKRPSRQTYMFTKKYEKQEQIDLSKFKSGNVGKVGIDLPPPIYEKSESCILSRGLMLPQATNVATKVEEEKIEQPPYIVHSKEDIQDIGNMDMKQKLLDLLQKSSVNIQNFFDMMEGLGEQPQEIEEIIENGKKNGLWFEGRSGFLQKL